MKTSSAKSPGRRVPRARPPRGASKEDRDARLARFPERNSNPVMRVSARGVVEYCNPAARKNPDWACKEGRPLPEALRSKVRRAMAAGRRAEFDVQLGPRWYSVWLVPFPAESCANLYAHDITARQQAEQALRQLNAELGQRVAEQTAELRRSHETAQAERQRLYSVLETLPAYVVLLSEDHHVPFANRFFRDRFGESHGKRCFDYLFGRSEPCESCESYKPLKTRAPHRWEWKGPDGRIYDVYDFPFTDADGSLMVMEMGLDITERKKIETALKEAKETLERRVAERTAALAENRADLNRAQAVAHTGSWRLNVQTNELIWSDENWRIFGLPRDIPLTYETFLSTVHPDDRASVHEKWSAALRGEAYDIEHRIVVDDQVKWVRERAELEFDEKGKLRGGFGTTQDITEKKRAEEALRRAKEEWERTFDAVPDLIAILDDRHRIVRANRAMIERLGTTPEQCVGMPCYRAVHGMDQPIATCPHARTLTDGCEHAAEVHEVLLGGDFLVSTTPLPGADGRMAGAVHVARDITDRKRAEKALRDREERYRSLFSNMSEGFALHEILCDAQGQPVDYCFLEVNPAFERITGLKREQVIGRRVLEVLPGTEPFWIENYGRVALTGEPARFESFSAGLGRWYEVFAFRPAERQFAVMFVDVTKTRQALEVEKQALAATAAAQTAIDALEAMGEGVLVMDMTGRIQSVNPAIERISGFPESEVEGRFLEELLQSMAVEEDRTRAIADVRRVLSGENTKPEPLTLTSKSGALIPVIAATSFIRRPDGQPTAIVVTIRDITDQRRMEADRERYQQRLRELAERLASTEERERRRISMQIHDTVIQTLSLCHIKMGALRKELAAAGLPLRVAEVNTVRAMVEEAIVESRSLMAELTPPLLYELGLVPALQDLTERLQKLYGTSVSVHDDGLPKPLDRATEGLLFQATRELMMNALKHAGPCSVNVDVSRQDVGLRVRVEDNGIGFTVPGDHRFVLHRGGGFGLFTIAERLEWVRGRVEIQSRPGEGTRAELTVPLAAPEPEAGRTGGGGPP